MTINLAFFLNRKRIQKGIKTLIIKIRSTETAKRSGRFIEYRAKLNGKEAGSCA
jgi:hypothetical protein